MRAREVTKANVRIEMKNYLQHRPMHMHSAGEGTRSDEAPSAWETHLIHLTVGILSPWVILHCAGTRSRAGNLLSRGEIHSFHLESQWTITITMVRTACRLPELDVHLVVLPATEPRRSPQSFEHHPATTQGDAACLEMLRIQARMNLRGKSIDVLCPNLKDKDHDSERHTKVELYDWEKIEVERERRAGDESGRVSILSGWSHLSVAGHILEEMEHGFGHIVGTTGVPNTGRGTRVYNESKYFWTPGKCHMGGDDSDSDDGAIIQFIGR